MDLHGLEVAKVDISSINRANSRSRFSHHGRLKAQLHHSLGQRPRYLGSRFRRLKACLNRLRCRELRQAFSLRLERLTSLGAMPQAMMRLPLGGGSGVKSTDRLAVRPHVVEQMRCYCAWPAHTNDPSPPSQSSAQLKR